MHQFESKCHGTHQQTNVLVQETVSSKTLFKIHCAMERIDLQTK